MRVPLALLVLALAGPATAQVYRCGNSYSNTPCPGGKAVDTSPATSAGTEGSLTTIYFCKGYDGKNFWTNEHCIKRGDSTLDREVRVPSHLSWSDKVKYAARHRHAAEALRRPRGDPTVSTASSQSDHSALCASYRQALASNESAARAGGSIRRMEHLAQERRNLIAQQKAAGCR